MRALIEGIGALFNMPVSEGKGRGHRITVLLVIFAAFAVGLWLTARS